MAASATFALKAGVWFRRGRLCMIAPASQATACLPSGRNSTYRPVQISGTGSPANKAALIVMAQAWLTLANQAERYGETILVGETPSPRSRSQQVAQQQQQPQPDDPGKKKTIRRRISV